VIGCLAGADAAHAQGQPCVFTVTTPESGPPAARVTYDTAFGERPATAPFNQDEETSGVVDVSSILGAGNYLLVDQAHYPINAANPNGFAAPEELVEGGQLLLLHIPLPVATFKDQCKSSGSEVLFRANGTPFRNQGDCIQYVNTAK
jgi:hypothetical protein